VEREETGVPSPRPAKGLRLSPLTDLYSHLKECEGVRCGDAYRAAMGCHVAPCHVAPCHVAGRQEGRETAADDDLELICDLEAEDAGPRMPSCRGPVRASCRGRLPAHATCHLPVPAVIPGASATLPPLLLRCTTTEAYPPQQRSKAPPHRRW